MDLDLELINAKKKYLQHLDYWNRFPLLDNKICPCCKDRRVLPYCATYSLPIKPIWSNQQDEECIVCTVRNKLNKT
jgi:hypothetical protein